MPSNHLTLCYPLLLLPSILPSISVFSNESVLIKSKGLKKKKKAGAKGVGQVYTHLLMRAGQPIYWHVMWSAMDIRRRLAGIFSL